MNNYKNIGFVVALENESKNILDSFGKFKKIIKIGNINIYKYKKNNLNLYFVNCGIGEIQASIITTLLILKFKIDLIINFGLVGSLNNKYKQGDLVFIKEIIHYDFSLNSIDKKIEGIYPKRESAVFKVNKIFNFDYDYVRIASGDKFISEENLRKNLIINHKCDVCDMESAGINLTCENFNTDRVFLKLVSDNADKNGDNDFKTTIKNGVTKYKKIIEKIIEIL